MKITGKCPKCSSDDIIRVDGFSLDYGLGGSAKEGATFTKLNVNRYICCFCGFVEEWIEEDDIARILHNPDLR